MEIPFLSLDADTAKKFVITLLAITVLEVAQAVFYRLQKNKWENTETAHQEKIATLTREKALFRDSLLVSESKVLSLKESLKIQDSIKTAQINKLENTLKRHEKSIATLSNANSDELGSFFSNYELNP